MNDALLTLEEAIKALHGQRHIRNDEQKEQANPMALNLSQRRGEFNDRIEALEARIRELGGVVPE